MQLTLASLALFLTLVSTTPTPLTRIALKRTSFTQNGIVDIDNLRSHLENVKVKIAQGFANYEMNTGSRHVSDNGALRKLLEKRATGKVPLENKKKAGLFQGQLDVGTPAETFSVDFDSGSGDILLAGSACTDENCAGHKLYDTAASSTAVVQCQNVTLVFGDGGVAAGSIFRETVSLGGLTATNQAVIAASQFSAGFALSSFPPDGLVGIAFQATAQTNSSPVFQSLIDQGQTTSPVFGFTLLDDGGSIFLGGTDTSAFTGDLTFTPVTRPAFWQISAQGVSVNNIEVITEPHEAIVDTGTTSIIMDTASAKAIYTAIPGAVNASDTLGEGLFTVPCDCVPNDLSFVLGGKPFTVSANTFNQRPVSNGSSDCLGGIIALDGFGLWILGDVFLKNVYTEFDVGNLQVGFAPLAT